MRYRTIEWAKENIKKIELISTGEIINPDQIKGKRIKVALSLNQIWQFERCGNAIERNGNILIEFYIKIPGEKRLCIARTRQYYGD